MRLFTLSCTVLMCACTNAGPSATDDGATCETAEGAGGCTEDSGAGRRALSSNGICRDACVSLAVAGCAGVATACIAGSGLTLGSVSIPCVVAAPLACGGGLGCADACWKLFPLSPAEALREW
jgi:hypothetical protein